jgi:CysZ protein
MYFKQERALMRRNKPLALGFGAGLMLMTLVPVLNFLAMPVGVTGATALWAERLKNQAASPPSGSGD